MKTINNPNNKAHTCCICGEKFIGFGNNPYPVKKEGRCCDECNWKYVIPARIPMPKK